MVGWLVGRLGWGFSAMSTITDGPSLVLLLFLERMLDAVHSVLVMQSVGDIVSSYLMVNCNGC